MYDAAIIGAGPSGLTAAVRLAHFGVKVCLIEAHTRLGGLNSWHHVKGLEISSGLHAFTNYTTGGRSGALGKLLRQLRMRFTDLELYPQGVSSIRFPSATLRFTNDPEFFRQQVAETFPNDIAGFDRLRLAVTSTDEGRFTTRQTSARAVLEECIHNPRLVDMLFCPVMFYGNPGGVGDGLDRTRTKPDMDWLLFCVVWKCIFETGLACPAGGMRGIWEQLAARFTDNDGELVTGVGVRQMTTTDDEKRVRTLILTDGREVEARTVFSSAGMLETARLLGDEEIRLDDSPISIVEGVSVLDRPSTSAGLADTTVFYSLDDAFAFARPQGLTDRRSGVLCAMDNYLLPEEKKKPVLKATCLASYPAWRGLEKAGYAKAKQQAAFDFADDMAQIGVTMGNAKTTPGKYGHFDDVFTPLTLERFTGHREGALYGSTVKSRTGETGLANLFLIGADQGFHGIVGAMLSGVAMVNRHYLSKYAP